MAGGLSHPTPVAGLGGALPESGAKSKAAEQKKEDTNDYGDVDPTLTDTDEGGSPSPGRSRSVLRPTADIAETSSASDEVEKTSDSTVRPTPAKPALPQDPCSVECGDCQGGCMLNGACVYVDPGY